MNAQFLDLDVILDLNAKVWIVDKTKPSIPIVRIPVSEFNLIRRGIYKSHNNPINFSGHTYWITEDMMNNIKIKSKNKIADVSNLGFSMQEFLNPEIIENLDWKLLEDNFSHLKNSDDDIYIICSKNNKTSYKAIISKIESKLKKMGLSVKEYYYISETFYDRDEDDISYKKARLILQHLFGFKTEGDKFTNEEIERYKEITFYDDDTKTINLCKNINELLRTLIQKSDDDIKSRVKEIIKEDEPVLNLNEVTFNRMNRFIETTIRIEYHNVIKSFESFKFKF